MRLRLLRVGELLGVGKFLRGRAACAGAASLVLCSDW